MVWAHLVRPANPSDNQIPLQCLQERKAGKGLERGEDKRKGGRERRREGGKEGRREGGRKKGKEGGRVTCSVARGSILRGPPFQLLMLVAVGCRSKEHYRETPEEHPLKPHPPTTPITITTYLCCGGRCCELTLIW